MNLLGFGIRAWPLAVLYLAVPASGQSITLAENFTTDPMANGWRIFGAGNLFEWDPTNHNLRVTWDSSQTNSYFYHLLGTIVTRDDDFVLRFDLAFEDYKIGATSGRTYTFPVAIGLLNLDNATQTNFSRGSGINAAYGAKNLVEFDFFPAFDTFSPTIAQAIVSTNNDWLYNHDNLLDMPAGDVFHIEMNYSALTRRLDTTTARNDAQYGQTQTITVPTNFDFRVAAVSVTILAHGWVDNLVVAVPPPPVENLSGYFTNGQWQVAFISRTNWLYTLERTMDFQFWTAVSTTTPGNGTALTIPDTNPPPARAYYRVRAEKP